MPQGCLRGLDGHRDRKLRFRIAFEGSPCRRHVGIIPADGNTDVAVSGHDIVGRVQSDPTEAGKICLDPGMRRIVSGSILVLATVMQISRNITRRHAPAARDRNRDMREILANAAFFRQSVIDR